LAFEFAIAGFGLGSEIFKKLLDLGTLRRRRFGRHDKGAIELFSMRGWSELIERGSERVEAVFRKSTGIGTGRGGFG
jgi:hypothetical protein